MSLSVVNERERQGVLAAGIGQWCVLVGDGRQYENDRGCLVRLWCVCGGGGGGYALVCGQELLTLMYASSVLLCQGFEFHLPILFCGFLHFYHTRHC